MLAAMKRILPVLLLIGLLGVLSAPSTIAQPEVPSSEREIRRLLDAQVQDWNRGELEGFMEGYWNSSELTFFSGANAVSGWQGTLDRYRRRYQSEGREMGRLEFREVRVVVLSEDAAFVRGRYHLELSSGETPTGLFTLIARRRPEGWRIVHDHTSS